MSLGAPFVMRTLLPSNEEDLLSGPMEEIADH